MVSTSISETHLSRRFGELLQSNEAFCEKFREACRLNGHGTIPSVELEYPHVPESGAIDIFFEDSGQRVLVENKINAGWSYNKEGVSQTERYRRSAQTLQASTLLLAPRKYLWGAGRKNAFDATLSYEALLPVLGPEDYAVVCEAIDRASSPIENPDAERTKFFQDFNARVAKVAPGLAMKNRDRNKASHTVHFDGRKSLLCHPRLPVPSIYLQLVKTGVNLFVRGWGRAIPELLELGGHEGAGIALHKTPRGTLGIGLPTPYVDVRSSFDEQTDAIDEAIRTTARLCNWWNNNSQVLESWRRQVEA